MVWYDFVMLGILVYAGWQGASRGLVMQLAWIVAIVLCFQFADKLSPQIEPLISVESKKLQHWIAMFILYLGFSLGTFVVARSLSNAIEKARFQEFDRQLGGLFGLIKGVLVALVVTFFAVTLSDGLRETVLRSKTGNIACHILDNVGPLIPADAHPLITESLEKYSEQFTSIHDDLGHATTPQEVLEDHLDEDEFFSDGGQSGRPDDFGRNDSAIGPAYSQFLSVLPADLRSSVGDSFRQQWDQLSAIQREDRINELQITRASSIGRTLQSWFRGSGGQGSGGGAADPRETELIQTIAQTYSDPQRVVLETEKHLAGVPQNVRKAVLEDWYADLTPSVPDPDRRTDNHSRIDDRIVNQMSRMGFSLDNLEITLRERLRDSLR